MAFAFAMVLSTHRASADTPAARPIREALHLEEGPCLDRDSLATAITRILERERLDARIDVEVRREEDAIVYRLLRDSKSVGERRLTHLPEDCGALRTALGAAIAVGIDAI